MVEGIPIIDESNYLDIWNLLANELIGSAVLTFFLGIVVIMILGAYKGWDFKVSGIFCILWASAVYAGSGLQWLWAYVVFFIGFIFYYKYGQMIQR